MDDISCARAYTSIRNASDVTPVMVCNVCKRKLDALRLQHVGAGHDPLRTRESIPYVIRAEFNRGSSVLSELEKDFYDLYVLYY